MPQTQTCENLSLPTSVQQTHTASSGPESHRPCWGSLHQMPIRTGTCLIHITATKANTVTFSAENGVSCFSTPTSPGIERWRVHYRPAWMHQESHLPIKPGIRDPLQLDQDHCPLLWPPCSLGPFPITLRFTGVWHQKVRREKRWAVTLLVLSEPPMAQFSFF